MPLYIERRYCGCSPRVFPPAVIKGKPLGITIQVEAPDEFKRNYPFVLACLFQEVKESAGAPRMMDGDTEEERNDVLDGIADACKVEA